MQVGRAGWGIGYSMQQQHQSCPFQARSTHSHLVTALSLPQDWNTPVPSLSQIHCSSKHSCLAKTGKLPQTLFLADLRQIDRTTFDRLPRLPPLCGSEGSSHLASPRHPAGGSSWHFRARVSPCGPAWSFPWPFKSGRLDSETNLGINYLYFIIYLETALETSC